MAAGLLVPDSLDWLGLTLHILGWLTVGYDVLWQMLIGVVRGRFFNESLLMTVATVGALCIGETWEAVTVMVLYQIGEVFQDAAVTRSRRSIAGLCDLRPDRALVLQDGKTVETPAETVSVGTRVLIRPGDMIPLDGIVIKGESTVNTAALTGESMPRAAAPGSGVWAGTVNMGGVLEIETTASAGETVAARTLKLIEEAERRKTRSERFITRFARIYTPIVMLLALLVAVIPPLLAEGDVWEVWIGRALVFLVASCPCALIISVPLCYFAGIGGAAHAGILVKGGSAMDALARTGLVAFDKTGTLTRGQFGIAEVFRAPGADEATLNRCTAIAEYHTTHPLGISLREYCGDVGYPAEKYRETPGYGVTASFGGQIIHAGSYEYQTKLGVKVPRTEGTTVYISLDNMMIGYYRFSDSSRSEAKDTVAALHKMGVSTAMLTGDKYETAQKIAGELGIDAVHAELLPEGKIQALEVMMGKEKGAVAFAGDGINDAAALTRADVGISLGGIGSDAALEAADVVLMNEDIAKIPEALRRAKKTSRIAGFNIGFAITFKAAVLILAALGFAPLWLAVIADVGVSLLAVLNAMRARMV